eukprot:6357856-Pyramimonas_sp.AAC.1
MPQRLQRLAAASSLPRQFSVPLLVGRVASRAPGTASRTGRVMGVASREPLIPKRLSSRPPARASPLAPASGRRALLGRGQARRLPPFGRPTGASGPVGPRSL